MINFVNKINTKITQNYRLFVNESQKMRRQGQSIGSIVSGQRSKSPQSKGFTKKQTIFAQNNSNHFCQDNPTERKNQHKASVSTNPAFESDSLLQYPISQQIRQTPTQELFDNKQNKLRYMQRQLIQASSKEMLQTKKKFKLDFSVQNSQQNSKSSEYFPSSGSNSYYVKDFDGDNTDSLNKYRAKQTKTKDPVIQKIVAIGNVFKYLKQLKKQCISQLQKQKFSFVQDCLLNIERQVLKKRD